MDIPTARQQVRAAAAIRKAAQAALRDATVAERAAVADARQARVTWAEVAADLGIDHASNACRAYVRHVHPQ